MARLYWPDSGALHPSIPDDVRKYYVEANQVRRASPSSFVVQIRRAIEALCRDRGVQKGVLKQRLDALAERGEIPPTLTAMADLIRLLGNIGAHDSSEDVYSADVEAVDAFFRAVVEYVYVAPARVTWVRESLEGRKRE
jgi:uncharacterized protein DUF4145